MFPEGFLAATIVLITAGYGFSVMKGAEVTLVNAKISLACTDPAYY